MKHLTPEEIERFAETPTGVSPDCGATGRTRHAAECARCRGEVGVARVVLRSLRKLPELSPSREFAGNVIAGVNLQVRWLEGWLAQLPQFAPSPTLSSAVMAHVDLPAPWLERALRDLPQVGPSPGFSARAMVRVRLPIPWHDRLWRFAREHRVALAGATVSVLTATGAGAAWLFGVQGVTPLKLATYLLSGIGDLAVRGLGAVVRVGYEFGLVGLGTAISDIGPTVVLGSLALVGTIELLSVWVAVRLMRTEPQLRLREAAGP